MSVSITHNYRIIKMVSCLLWEPLDNQGLGSQIVWKSAKIKFMWLCHLHVTWLAKWISNILGRCYDIDINKSIAIQTLRLAKAASSSTWFYTESNESAKDCSTEISITHAKHAQYLISTVWPRLPVSYRRFQPHVRERQVWPPRWCPSACAITICDPTLSSLSCL